MTFGEKVQILRKAKGMSQEQLAKRLNVSRQAISKWEQGLATPDVSNVIELSKLFNVSIDYLLIDYYGNDDHIPPVAKNDISGKALPGTKMSTLVGGLISFAGAAGILILCIIGSVRGKAYWVFGGENARVYTGIAAFLKINTLTWLMVLCVIAVLIGLVVIFSPKIKNWLSN